MDVLWPLFFSTMRHLFFILLLVASCSPPETGLPVVYDGPIREAEHIELHYAENLTVKVILKARKVREFQNGDRDFPEGIYLEFFDESGQLTSTLRANEARYFKQDNQWRARGKVEVLNLQKNEQLNTEELFWKPSTEEIFTESFVTIRLENEVIYGEGLQAKQDMSDYTIKKPQGEFVIREEP
jgi:LPS export ABC transporter protein LptC